MATRRVVFGFYAPNKYKFGEEGWQKEREGLTERTEKFKRLGYIVDGTKFNPTNFNQAIVWIDK